MLRPFFHLRVFNTRFVIFNSDSDFKETFMHEMAHALTGPGNGHNEKWRMKCIELGIEPKRISRDRININHNYEVWCPECEVMLCERDRKTDSICKRCRSKVEWVRK